LAQAYLRQGLNLRSRGFVEEALAQFEQVLALEPHQPLAEQEAFLASTYLTGAEHYQAGHWEEAIAALEQIRAEDSSYIHSGDLLYSAYYNLALARQAADEFAGAKKALESAIALRPDLSTPRRLLAEIEFALAPETPLEIPLEYLALKDRLIIVGLAEQRMLVYDGGQKVFDFVVSTGEPGRETVPGEFEILNKIDVAYAATWNLDMPYWMGIYWAGPLQNGIHALPIVKHTGYKLWDGYLGQRVSYGCVILSDEDAATLYNWTQVGTKVKIVPSLAEMNDE
jgi:tetratricopeptide (TPR) repeat protein